MTALDLLEYAGVLVIGVYVFVFGLCIMAGRCSDEEARSARWPE